MEEALVHNGWPEKRLAATQLAAGQHGSGVKLYRADMRNLTLEREALQTLLPMS